MVLSISLLIVAFTALFAAAAAIQLVMGDESLQPEREPPVSCHDLADAKAAERAAAARVRQRMTNLGVEEAGGE